MATPTFSKNQFLTNKKRVSPIEWGRTWKMRVHKLATPLGILRIKLEHYLRKMWRLIGLLEGTLFRQGDLVSLLDCFAILTCLIALDDHLIACSPQHDSLSRMLDRTLIVWYLFAWYDCLLHDNPFSCMIVWLLVFVHYLTLDLRFFGCTHILHCAL